MKRGGGGTEKGEKAGPIEGDWKVEEFAPDCEFTNTQIQLMTKCQKYPTYAIFLNSWWFKDVKNDNSDPRYTVDFCTVPPGLLLILLT